jgi:hypothetical protein
VAAQVPVQSRTSLATVPGPARQYRAPAQDRNDGVRMPATFAVAVHSPPVDTYVSVPFEAMQKPTAGQVSCIASDPSGA